MRSRRRRQASAGSFLILAVCALCLALGTACASAQTISPATADALHAMSRQAGVIFAGQVIAVRRHDGFNGATGVVEIDFAVDDAICGVRDDTYTLREWAGLWMAGDEPFRVGRRYLMLLHPPGPAGLSSPIGGPDGAIPIRGNDGPQPGAISPQTDGRRVDLRWIATHGTRPTSYRPDSVARPIGRPVTLHPNAVVADLTAGGEAAAPIALAADATAHTAAPIDDYTAVLTMLRSWERVDHAAR